MSGLLWPRRLPVTELFRGFADPPKNGLVETTTPPETGVGPEGTLPEIWLPVTSMSVVPRSGMPIPEKFAPHCAARHERVLFSTVLPFTSKSSMGYDGAASKNMPAQLSWRLFPTTEPRWASMKVMPHAPPEMLLPTTVVRELLMTQMPAASFSGSVSGLPITWFFARVVLPLLKAKIAPDPSWLRNEDPVLRAKKTSRL